MNMGRRNSGLLEDLLTLLSKLPWWISVIVSAMVYIFLKWILPTIQFDSVLSKSFAQSLPNVAGYIAFIFLLPAFVSFFNSWRKKQSFNNQFDDQEDLVNICPRCGNQLVERTAKKSGRKFYGCSSYPRCKFTKDY